jgi:UDP-N-acetylmuramate--alanine ligase
VSNTDTRPIHFVGIAGAGMRALAELLARRGIAVSGCDANPGRVEDLEALGIHVLKGHSPEHVEGASELIVTSAMNRNHPEIVRAKELGIPVTRRAEALARAVEHGKVIGVAGTHGKTTTTVMTTAALAAAGLRPTGIAGGRVGEWKGNLRYEGDDLFVVEADEYDRSFLTLTPTVAVVTSLEADHLDIYRDLDDIRSSFARFVHDAAAIVLCDDDSGARSLDVPPTAEVIRYGLGSRDARLVARDVRSNGVETRFAVEYDGDVLGEIVLQVPGNHNIQNSLAAIGVGLALGVELEAMRPGLAAFGGVDRRFQRLCEVQGVTIIDDYAHHPTEILATLQAARSAYPGRRIIAAFQPHLFSRTRDFATEFGAALAKADSVFLAEVYPAREQPIEGVSSELIASALRGNGGTIDWQGSRATLALALCDFVRDGDVVLTIGAGDITKTGPELRTALEAKQ